MRRHRYAKIVATLGPASSSPERIHELFMAGADVFRLNFSHGTLEDHRARLQAIRQVEAGTGRPIGVLLDLQGPKLRVGRFEAGAIELVTNQSFRLDLDPNPGDARRAPLPHQEIFAALRPGTNLLLDDGRIRLRVERCGANFAETTVVTSGRLSNNKGVNVPDVVLPISSLTDKDRADLIYGLSLGVDFVAASFIQRAANLEEIRQLVDGKAMIMAKLEKPAAIEYLDEIVAAADSIMVARGDLGVELPPEKVPSVQKRIIRACREAGKPVVVATQMLESMISSPVPTRAEASDVATAVYDGADAVMLSGETATGDYPVEAVSMMNRIIGEIERDPYYRKVIDAQTPAPQATVPDAICEAMRAVAHTLPIAVTVTFTSSGSTSLRAARERPSAPIISLTPHLSTARRLSLVWGVHSVQGEDIKRVTDMVRNASRTALEEGFAETGESLVITAGIPFGHSGTTNMLRIAQVGEAIDID